MPAVTAVGVVHTVAVPDAAAMRELGARLASVLRAGDLVLLSGELGAGKTTLTQGIGAGLGVRGPVTSPTFVLARVHPSLVGGPLLVHVDAYRLGSFAEVEDLDLDASLEESVTVVEWGSGRAEGLASDRLEVAITRAVGPEPVGPGAAAADSGSAAASAPAAADAAAAGTDPRVVRVSAVGERWTGRAAEQLAAVLARTTG